MFFFQSSISDDSQLHADFPRSKIVILVHEKGSRKILKADHFVPLLFASLLDPYQEVSRKF